MYEKVFCFFKKDGLFRLILDQFNTLTKYSKNNIKSIHDFLQFTITYIKSTLTNVARRNVMSSK